MPETQINWIAVLVSTGAAFVLGGLWYSPLLFAKQWVALNGYDEERVKQMQKSAGPAYAGCLVSQFLMAVVLSVIFSYAGVKTMNEALWIGFLCWGGIALTIGFSGHLFGDRKNGLFYIDVTYQLVYMLVMSAILGSWR